jgi:hypothetical protein
LVPDFLAKVGIAAAMRGRQTAMSKRFEDKGEDLYSFMDEILVTCSRCGSCAVIRQIGPEKKSFDLFAPRRLTCTGCSYTKESENREIRRATYWQHDDFFHRPLWLQTPCCGEVLWAYNERHLEFLEGYVGAQLRERLRGEHGWSNASMASRLPGWIKSAKKRAEVMKGLARLRLRLNGER